MDRPFALLTLSCILQLELQLQPELHYARRVGGAGDYAERTGGGEVRHSSGSVQRQGKAGVVKRVEGLGIEFQVELLLQLEVLDERQVRIGKVRAVEIVARSHLQSQWTGE